MQEIIMKKPTILRLQHGDSLCSAEAWGQEADLNWLNRWESEVAPNKYERSDLGYLVYNDPAAYEDLILNGDGKDYLGRVTDYLPIFRGL